MKTRWTSLTLERHFLIYTEAPITIKLINTILKFGEDEWFFLQKKRMVQGNAQNGKWMLK